MDRDILLEVVRVEKEIQESLEAEKRKAAESVERARQNASKALLAEEARLRDASKRAVKGSRARAEKKASGVLEDFRSEANRINSLGDDVLLKILSGHMRGILPQE